MPFDANTFINQGVGFAMPDEYPAHPEGDYPGTCVDYKVVPPEGDRSPFIETNWRLDGVSGAPIRYTVWLDVDANGQPLQGDDKNVSLGQLRSALGQNNPGQQWTPEMLRNGRALCHIGPKKGRFQNITRVARLPGQAAPGQPAQAPAMAPQGPGNGQAVPQTPPPLTGPYAAPQPPEPPQWTGQPATPAAPAAPAWGPPPTGTPQQ